MFRKSFGIILIALILVSAFVALFWQLGSAPLQDYDEATYVQVVHEALANHDFIFFTCGGGAFLSKPPLMFWAMSVSEAVFGETEFAMRAPSALFGVLLIALLMAFAYELSRRYTVAVLAGAIALTTAPLVETAREVRMDLLVSLCIMAATYAFVRGLRDPRWFVVAGLCVGLGVMAKSVIAIFALVMIASLIVFSRRFDVLKNMYAWYGVAAGVLVALPWHLIMWARYGSTFWQQYIGVEVLARTQQNLFWTVTITNADLWNYANQFVEPWLWVFALSIGIWLLQKFSFPERGEFSAKNSPTSGAVAPAYIPDKLISASAIILASLVTMACMIAVFAFSVTKAPTYLIPLYPFGALIIALTFEFLFQTKLSRWSACTAVALVLWGGVLTIYNAYHLNPYYSSILGMAVDEQAIGKLVSHTPPTLQWYTYNDSNVGSIMYYSQRLTALTVLPQTTFPPNSYLVMGSDKVDAFEKDHPKAHLAALYQGTFVSLFEVQ